MAAGANMYDISLLHEQKFCFLFLCIKTKQAINIGKMGDDKLLRNITSSATTTTKESNGGIGKVDL
jgi:hypothetical protein